jgi:predicted Zn-dependent protease
VRNACRERRGIETLVRTLAIAVVIAWLPCCSVTGFNARPQPVSPDQPLCDYLGALRRARADGGQAEVVPGDAGTRMDVHRIESELRRLALEFPTHVPTLFANAMLSYEVDDRESAQRYLDRLLTIDPGHVDAAVLRCRIALREGDVPLAKNVLERAIAVSPDQAELHETMAAVDFVAGHFDAAQTELATAENLGTPRWRAAFDRGLVAESLGERDFALSQYAIVLSERPEFEPAQARSRALQASPSTAGIGCK